MSTLKLNRIRTTILATTLACLIASSATPVAATIIADVTHLKGRRQNHLMGYGLVVGLNGTGDGDKYAASIRQLQSMLEKFEVPVMQSELKGTKNVAIVWVEVTMPENGIREGDRVDVHVSAVGASKSLLGGRLVMTPMQDVTRSGLYAWAQGAVRVTNLKQPTTGIITRGAVMEEDFIHHYINDAWQITLVLEDIHASHALAAVIAQSINEDQSEIGQVRRLALATDPKNVIVSIPEAERGNPAEFIGRIEGLELLMPQGEGRIVINRATQTIAIGAGVEIGEAIIAHGGMTIRTTTPAIKPTVETPKIEDKRAVKIGSGQRGGAKLQELVDKLNELNVPAKDIIEIIETLYRAQKIRGKLVYTDTTDKE
ncbi:MAG: flagellar basal body P-ring protein FlgI [Phycisphaerae bacterium]